jgi:hypothetical protein
LDKVLTRNMAECSYQLMMNCQQVLGQIRLSVESTVIAVFPHTKECTNRMMEIMVTDHVTN